MAPLRLSHRQRRPIRQTGCLDSHKFGFKDNSITIATVLEYQAKAWAKALVLTHSVSCGTDPKKPKPRIRVVLSVTYDLTRIGGSRPRRRRSNWPR